MTPAQLCLLRAVKLTPRPYVLRQTFSSELLLAGIDAGLIEYRLTPRCEFVLTETGKALLLAAEAHR